MELPTAVYERLQAEATRDGRTTAQVTVDVLTDGWDAREHHGRVVDEIHELRIELERTRWCAPRPSADRRRQARREVWHERLTRDKRDRGPV